MTRFITGAWLLCGLIGLSGLARAQLANPPPSKPLSGFGSYELRPVELDQAEAAQERKNKAARTIQQELDTLVVPIVADWNSKPAPEGAPRLVIAPRIDGITIGETQSKGVFGRDSIVTMHVRFIEQPGDVVIAEPMFFQRAAAWGAAYSFGGTDTAMLRRIVRLMADYLPANYERAVGGPTGLPK